MPQTHALAADAGPDFTAKDDGFHFDVMGDRWWMTETAWFSFCAPERKLGGWLYSMFRPNIGVNAGGVWVWDDGAHIPWETRYYRNYTAMPLPEGDLTDTTLRTGVKIKVLEPLTRYHLGFEDEDGRLSIDLEYEAVMAPRALRKPNSSFKNLAHFDQFMRARGHIVLDGERIDIDCHSMRDRSWGPRPEHRPGKSAYVSGIASPDDCFLCTTKWNDPTGGLAYGFQTLDGELGDIVEGRRIVERSAEHGYVAKIVIEAKDHLGREMVAEGERLSSITINRHSFIDSNALIAWTINGKPGHGEDQDMWPVHDWADFRRRVRAGGAE